MLFSEKQTIEDTIVSQLSSGPQNSLNLLKKIQNIEPVTKQGFYKALKSLLEKDVITKNKQIILLNPIWTKKLDTFVQDIYTKSNTYEYERFLKMKDGDTITFNFKSPLDVYTIWNHYFFIFTKQSNTPTLFFNSHNFWTILNRQTQNEMYSWIKKLGKQVYAVVGYNTPLDRNTSDYIEKEYDIHLAYENSPSIKESIFPAIFDEHIISTIIDNKTTKAIHALYQEYTENNAQLKNELLSVISKAKRTKIIIEKNKNKAEKMRKKLMNYFIFYNTKK